MLFLIELLSSLNEVNFIIFQSQSLKHLCEAIHPTTIFSLENGILSQIDPNVDFLSRLRNVLYESKIIMAT